MIIEPQSSKEAIDILNKNKSKRFALRRLDKVQGVWQWVTKSLTHEQAEDLATNMLINELHLAIQIDEKTVTIR